MKHLRVSHYSQFSLWHFPTEVALFFLVQGLLKWTYLQISYPSAWALLTCIGNRQTFPECELWNGSCMDAAQRAHVGTRVPALPPTHGFTWHSELWRWPRCLLGRMSLFSHTKLWARWLQKASSSTHPGLCIRAARGGRFSWCKHSLFSEEIRIVKSSQDTFVMTHGPSNTGTVRLICRPLRKGKHLRGRHWNTSPSGQDSTRCWLVWDSALGDSALWGLNPGGLSTAGTQPCAGTSQACDGIWIGEAEWVSGFCRNWSPHIGWWGKDTLHLCFKHA